MRQERELAWSDDRLLLLAGVPLALVGVAVGGTNRHLGLTLVLLGSYLVVGWVLAGDAGRNP